MLIDRYLSNHNISPEKCEVGKLLHQANDLLIQFEEVYQRNSKDSTLSKIFENAVTCLESFDANQNRHYRQFASEVNVKKVKCQSLLGKDFLSIFSVEVHEKIFGYLYFRNQLSVSHVNPYCKTILSQNESFSLMLESYQESYLKRQGLAHVEVMNSHFDKGKHPLHVDDSDCSYTKRRKRKLF